MTEPYNYVTEQDIRHIINTYRFSILFRITSRFVDYTRLRRIIFFFFFIIIFLLDYRLKLINKNIINSESRV